MLTGCVKLVGGMLHVGSIGNSLCLSGLTCGLSLCLHHVFLVL